MSRFDEVSPTFEALTVRKVKVAAQTHLSAQMARDTRVDTAVDHASASLVVRLTTDLLRHKVDAQTVRVPFEQTESKEAPGPRYVVAAFALLVALAIVLGAVTATIVPFLLAAAAALAGVIVHATNPPRDVTLTVAGEAVVNRTLFNAFPDASIVYPESLGDIWLPMQEVSSYAAYRDPDA